METAQDYETAFDSYKKVVAEKIGGVSDAVVLLKQLQEEGGDIDQAVEDVTTATEALKGVVAVSIKQVATTAKKEKPPASEVKPEKPPADK
jgi:hypothetical protein